MPGISGTCNKQIGKWVERRIDSCLKGLLVHKHGKQEKLRYDIRNHRKTLENHEPKSFSEELSQPWLTTQDPDV